MTVHIADNSTTTNPIVKAVAVARPGDVIKVVPTAKPYTDYFATSLAGTAAAPIVITSATAERPKITPASSWVFLRDYWQIEHMDFIGFSARPVQIGGSPLAGLGPDNMFANAITVRDCLFRHATQEAIWVCHTNQATICGCVFRDVRRRRVGEDICAVCVYGGTDVLIDECLGEDIGSDVVHIGTRFHDIGAVTIRNTIARVNRPYGSVSWQDWGLNVAENAFDVKQNWDSITPSKRLTGPVLIVGCEVHGFQTAVLGQDCSDGVRGGQPGSGIAIHCDATPIHIQATRIHDCDVGLTAGKGTLGTTAGFSMTEGDLYNLDIGIELNGAAAGVTIHDTKIIAREGLHVHTTPITFKNNIVDSQTYMRGGQTGQAEQFAGNRWINALPPEEWRSLTDWNAKDEFSAIAAELDADAEGFKQVAALLNIKADAIVARAAAVRSIIGTL